MHLGKNSNDEYELGNEQCHDWRVSILASRAVIDQCCHQRGLKYFVQHLLLVIETFSENRVGCDIDLFVVQSEDF